MRQVNFKIRAIALAAAAFVLVLAGWAPRTANAEQVIRALRLGSAEIVCARMGFRYTPAAIRDNTVTFSAPQLNTLDERRDKCKLNLRFIFTSREQHIYGAFITRWPGAGRIVIRRQGQRPHVLEARRLPAGVKLRRIGGQAAEYKLTIPLNHYLFRPRVQRRTSIEMYVPSRSANGRQQRLTSQVHTFVLTGGTLRPGTGETAFTIPLRTLVCSGQVQRMRSSGKSYSFDRPRQPFANCRLNFVIVPKRSNPRNYSNRAYTRYCFEHPRATANNPTGFVVAQFRPQGVGRRVDVLKGRHGRRIFEIKPNGNIRLSVPLDEVMPEGASQGAMTTQLRISVTCADDNPRYFQTLLTVTKNLTMEIPARARGRNRVTQGVRAFAFSGANTQCQNSGMVRHRNTGDRVTLPFVAADRLGQCRVNLSFQFIQGNPKMPPSLREARHFYDLWPFSGTIWVYPPGAAPISMKHDRLRSGVSVRVERSGIVLLRVPYRLMFRNGHTASVMFVAKGSDAGDPYVFHGGKIQLSLSRAGGGQAGGGQQSRYTVNNHRVMEPSGGWLICGTLRIPMPLNRNTLSIPIPGRGIQPRDCNIQVSLRHKPSSRFTTIDLMRRCFNEDPERARAVFSSGGNTFVAEHGSRGTSVLLMRGNTAFVIAPLTRILPGNARRASLRIQAGCPPQGNEMKRLLSEVITIEAPR